MVEILDKEIKDLIMKDMVDINKEIKIKIIIINKDKQMDTKEQMMVIHKDHNFKGMDNKDFKMMDINKEVNNKDFKANNLIKIVISIDQTMITIEVKITIQDTGQIMIEISAIIMTEISVIIMIEILEIIMTEILVGRTIEGILSQKITTNLMLQEISKERTIIKVIPEKIIQEISRITMIEIKV